MFRHAAVFVIASAAVLAAQTPATRVPQSATPGQVPRDTPAQTPAQSPATAKISGRVVAADSGRPIVRARVSVSNNQGSGGVVLTGADGTFQMADLPAGRFTVQSSKAGYISLQYGQRRPMQAGTPIQLADGQELKNVDFALPHGGAISGRVLDENNEPMPGIPVSVLEYRYMQGARTLSPSGSAQTDDRGEYRVWGLNPGDYYISATPPPAPGGVGGRGLGPAAVGRGAPARGSVDTPALGYAPTYYPGVMSAGEARSVTLGLSSELNDVSFSVLLVRTARVSGRVVNADGTPAAGGMLNLTSDDPGRRNGPGGRVIGAPIAGDGQFSFANVPPGRYVLRARPGNGNGRGRGNANATPMFASTPVALNGDDVAGISLVLAPGAGVSGTATFQLTQSAAANPNQFRVTAPPADFDFASASGQASIDAKTGAFSIDGLEPGARILQAQTPRGWMLKSVTIDGRDVTDMPFDVKSGQKISNVALVFTDKIGEVNGTVSDSRGAAATEYTVIVFPEDPAFWRPMSRRIMTARPDQNGKYQIRGLPAGSYYVAIADPAVQGEWFDPAFLDAQRSAAQRIALADGDVRVQDFRLAR
jgi:hypothetical protein